MLSRNHVFARGVGLVSPLAMVDELRREMHGPFENVGRSGSPPSPLASEIDAWPDIEIEDEGHRFVLRMEAPGVTERDVDVGYDQGAVTLRIARDTTPPDGWTAHRRERASYRFARTVSLPTNVDPEHAEATLRDGVFEISLPKIPAAKPRRLTVRSAPSN